MMETKKQNCTCGSDDAIVLACSGASDVGHISDLTARKLRDNGIFKMSCLALIGAGIENSIEDFKTKKIVVIDGCPLACGKKIMKKNGIDHYQYLGLSDIGLAKGASPATNENVELAYSKARSLHPFKT